jgi:dienelactone hydrolase
MSLSLVRRVVLLTVPVLAFGVGCSGDPADSGADTDPDATAPTASPTSVESYDPGPWKPLSELERCGPQPPRLADLELRQLTLRSQGRVLPGVLVGRGSTVAILVHQTDGGGFCGWLSFADRIAAVPGQAAVAVDLCGYGAAECADEPVDAAHQVAQVQVVIGQVVRRYHPRRIVLVGASMGGSLAVLTAATDDRVDAVVDLSGPDEWRDATVHEEADKVGVPLLVAMADSDGATEVAAARETVEAAGPDSRFVGAETGHGYALLEESDGRPSAFSDEVLAWIAGS